MIGLTRGVSTLAGAVVAGILLWFATQVGAETSGEYWATYGLVAAAGLAMALSQILGGWTKWGWPRLSIGVFLLGFLPVLAAGGWVLLARQPADWMNTSNWSRDAGFYGLVQDLGNILPAIAFGIGLTFGLVFDTSGPRREVVGPDVDEDVRQRRRRDADEPVTAERHAHARETVPAGAAARRGDERYGDDDRHATHGTDGRRHDHDRDGYVDDDRRPSPDDGRPLDDDRQPVAAGDVRRSDDDGDRHVERGEETGQKRHWWSR